MKNEESVKTIEQRRKENEPSKIICIREINDNLKRVFDGRPLTRPLATLNKNCEFRERYKIACELKEEETHKKCSYCKQLFPKEDNKFYCSEECKEKITKYNKEYFQRSGHKKRSREKQRISLNIKLENYRVK